MEAYTTINSPTRSSAVRQSVGPAGRCPFEKADLRRRHGAITRGSEAEELRGTEVTIFKSLGLAVEDVMAADLAYRRATERGIGTELVL